ncbi:hypothetical protein [Dysgonomonas sp. GY617]|uniref:hypothetical protein n=1 Tax=Dysgonomonas sp. GY617 TaxID=2780420 RepID=UPI0018847CD2|nr:hypothetical protein [Dysgonomonas sp. GY617]MBF0576014.1 hypothetical protein [Dysgonomonas sp. GY617]
MNKFKGFIIMIGNLLRIPIIILAICSFVFDKELRDWTFITYILYIILLMAIIVILSGILEYLEKNKEK